jgi:3-hexulose-6-phosphate synthase
MLLQLAIDKPEQFAVLLQVRDFVDIVEVGTPVLKRFGLSAIATARELSGGTPILADTKTVDGGALEAEMVFSAGASLMTVLSNAAPATHDAVNTVAERHRAHVIADTIVDTGPPASPNQFPNRYAYVSLHMPTDVRAKHGGSTEHIAAVADLRLLGYQVSLAGGLGPEHMEAVVQAAPSIVVVGSAITEASNPRGVAEWIAQSLAQPGRGWPQERS